MARKRAYPLPELVSSGRWTIHSDDRARVNLKSRDLYVPLQADRQWANIRAHELAHIRFTPEKANKPKGVSELAIQVCEDMRVNHLAALAGVDFSAGGPDHIVQGAALASKDQPKLACGLLVSDLRGVQNAQIFPHIQAAWKDDPTFDRIYQTARSCRRLMGNRRFGRSGGKPWTFQRTKAVARWFDEQWANPDNDDIGTDPGDPYKPKPGLGEGWGQLTIEHPPLPLFADKYTKRPKSVDYGDIPVQPWRVTTDDRIFRFRKPTRKGTIVIDASGSMHLDADMVASMARQLPAATIAAYDGYSRSAGQLRILAKNGKIADPLSGAYKFGRANIVDGPVLQWLGSMPEPRVWICDGIVTGKNEDQSTAIRENARALQRSGRILRTTNVEHAIAYFARKRTAKVYKGLGDV